MAALQAAADRLSPEIIRKRLDYWTLILGPKFSAKERKQLNLSRFYAISQIEYCRNFIFKRNFPSTSCSSEAANSACGQLAANKIAEIFGTRLHRRHRGKLATVIDQIEHGHHVFRAYFKTAFLKQYEKFSTFLRNELCSNNLADFGLKKGLDHLDAVRQTFQAITDRFAGFQAQWLNVHVDFPLLQRIALPITIGSVRYPGIKIHDRRVIRLCEVILHAGSHLGGSSEADPPGRPHHLPSLQQTYGLNQLRYDLRKLKGHGLIERDGSATPTVSPQKVSRSRCCFYFSTNVCADHSPTAASTTRQTQNTAHRASSKPHTTAPTKPSNKLSSCWQPHDRANINVEVALFENQLRYDLRKLKGHGLIERDKSATPTVSPQKVSRSRCCFYFSTNVCADHSPTAASTTSQTQNTAHRASSKPHTTAPTKPSNKLSSCWQPHDRANINVEVALFENLRVEFQEFISAGIN